MILKNFIQKNQRLFYLYFEKNVKEVKSLANKYFKYETSIIKSSITSRHTENDILKFCKKNKIDCLLNAGTPRRLQKDFLNSLKIGVINTHPGNLPKYRVQIVLSGFCNDKIKVSSHLMDEYYDSGPIILKRNIILNYTKLESEFF